MPLTTRPERDRPEVPVRPAAAAVGRDFRPDIQGLRAIAVSMVVIYHLYPSAIPGGFVGVDVFFVISGFLITGHLARSWQRSGRVRLLDFWGRRARRLLPAAAVVLTVTWLVSRAVLPATRLPATAEQIRGSALYYQNWILARDAVDYLTSADAPSPVQHFWSLSVEEQFYLFWPFVFVAAALVGLRGRARAGRTAAFVLAAAIVVASLIYSSSLTASNPAAAYFVTPTRIWELGLGGLLALLSRPVREWLGRQGWLGWLGLAKVVGSAFVIDGSSAFPGTVALLPVGGAALLIASGSPQAVRGPAPLTSVRPMVFIGDVSYSLYLWHWPVIVLWKNYSGGNIGVLDGPAIAAISVLLAWVTKVLVEDRVRLAPFITKHPGRSLATALTVLIPVGLAAVYTPPAAFHGTVDATHPGAAVLARKMGSVPPAPPIPSVAQAPTDFDPFSSCETPIPLVKPRPCFYGDRKNPKLTVALVGDSVANQYRSILAHMATKQHWLVISDLHGQCPWTATLMAQSGTTKPYTACHQWGAQVLSDMLTTYHPDVLITSERPVLGTPSHSKADPTSFGQIADGMVTYWKRLAAAGTRIVAVREAPEPGRNIPDCLSRAGADAASCTSSTKKAIIQHTALEQAVAKMGAGAELMDINSLICNQHTCPPIIGNVVVYRDTHHLTQTYIGSLEPYFAEQLLATRAMRAVHG
jgi:peptidoglycan/LPS O-acetylase OafA/YrhL